MTLIVSDYRRPDHPIDPLFVERYSPRAMSGENVSDHQLMMLLEAARWAPSSYNEQPWRYVYARRGTPHFDTLFSYLLPANQAWSHTAAVLILIASKKTFTRNGSPNSVFAFDAGSSWENLALQGAQLGLVIHAMAGFDGAKAREGLKIPEDFEPLAMVAIGKPGPIENLPESYRSGEMPSPRKPISEWAWEGEFRA